MPNGEHLLWPHRSISNLIGHICRRILSLRGLLFRAQGSDFSFPTPLEKRIFIRKKYALIFTYRTQNNWPLINCIETIQKLRSYVEARNVIQNRLHIQVLTYYNSESNPDKHARTCVDTYDATTVYMSVLSHAGLYINKILPPWNPKKTLSMEKR